MRKADFQQNFPKCVDAKHIVLIRGEVSHKILYLHNHSALHGLAKEWLSLGVVYLGENLIISNSFIFIAVFPSYFCCSSVYQKGHMEKIVPKRMF